MFNFKKKSASRTKSDHSTTSTFGSDNLLFPSGGGAHDDIGAANVLGQYDDTMIKDTTTKKPILKKQRSKSGSLLRRKKSFQEHQDLARTRALEMSIEFENNASEEYLSLNTKVKVKAKKNKKSKKTKNAQSPSGHKPYTSFFRRSAPKSSNNANDVVSPMSREQDIASSHSHDVNSDVESVFTNPFEDESSVGDDASLSSFKSAVSTMTLPNPVDLPKIVPKTNFDDWIRQPKDSSGSNPFEDDWDISSNCSVDVNDDSSVGSYSSAYSKGSVATMPARASTFSSPVRSHLVRKKAVRSGNPYHPSSSSSTSSERPRCNSYQQTSSTSLSMPSIERPRCHSFQPSSVTFEKPRPYQYPPEEKLRAYAPRASAYSIVPNTQEAALLHQARHHYNNNNKDPLDSQTRPRPKLHQVSDNYYSTMKANDYVKDVEPISPSNSSTSSTTSGSGLRSKFFSRKFKAGNLSPPALM